MLCFEPWDLRFADAADEASFKKHVEPEVVRNGAVLTGVMSLMIALRTGVVLAAEATSHGDRPAAYEWGSLDDPRTWYFALCAFNWALTLAGSGCLVARRRLGWLKVLDAEVVVLVTVSAACILHFVGNRCTMPLLLGRRPLDTFAWGDSRRDEPLQYLCVGLAMTAVGTMLPVRSKVLWCFPASSTGLALVLRLSLGSVFDEAVPSDLLAFVMLCAFATYGAWQREQHTRLRWLTIRSLEQSCKSQLAETQQAMALTVSMQTVAEGRCDIIVKLDANMKVWNADRCTKHFFGRQMEGLLFTDILADDDRTRFVGLLRRASSSELPQSLPVCISTSPRSETFPRANVLVVSTGQAVPSHFVGISVTEEEPAMGHGIRPWPDGAECGVEDDFAVLLPGMVNSLSPPAAPDRVVQQPRAPGSVAPHSDAESAVSFSLTCTETYCTRDDRPGATGKVESGTQVDPARTEDRGENTSVSWWDECGFVCRACMRPPRQEDPMAPSRGSTASTRTPPPSKRRSRGRSSSRSPRCSDAEQPRHGSCAEPYRRSLSRSAGPGPPADFDGDWVLEDNYPGVCPWLKRLGIRGTAVIDGNGESLRLESDGGRARLCGADLVLRDGKLYRHGNSGTLFVFNRE